MQEKSKPVDNLRADAEKIITRAIAAVLPDAAVERALKGKTFLGRVYLVAAGKAAWQMAHAARADGRFDRKRHGRLSALGRRQRAF